MKKLLVSAIALFAMTAQNAFAINLTFQFDVNSSGPSIYACNAGIKHGSNGQGPVCFDRTDITKQCSPGCAAGDMNACSNDGVKAVNCSCTGENYGTGNQGTYRMDFLQAVTAEWTDNQVGTATGETKVLTADGVQTGKLFNQLFGTDTVGANTNFQQLSAYKQQIKSLSINLGSEVYGAEYFVDICYRGPQIDYRVNGSTVSGLNFGLKAYATLFDVKKADGQSYKDLAGLQVKAEARCIMDDEFNYCLADVLPGDTSGCGQNTNIAHNYYFDGNKGFQPLTAGTTVAQLINDQAMAWSGNKTPRYCQIRYSFKESTQTMRKWKLQQARICTYSEITEPVSN